MLFVLCQCTNHQSNSNLNFVSLPTCASLQVELHTIQEMFLPSCNERLMLTLSSSDEVDVLSIKAGETEDTPPHSSAYEELVDVLTRAVAK